MSSNDGDEMKRRVAILGATGLIGKAIFSLFNKAGIDVKTCSKSGGRIKGYPVSRVDISKNGNLSQWLETKDVDAIIYLSCKIPKTFPEADMDLFCYNLTMHKQVLDYWKKHKCHLIYASSCSIYGADSPLPWKEERLVFPDNYYSTSKLTGETLFYQEFRKGLPLTILRISAPYGMGIRQKTVVNVFLEAALKGKDIILFGDGNRQQDFIYVLDVARAFCITYLNKKYGVYNIASGRTTTMKELASIIIKLTSSSSNIIYSRKSDAQERFQVKVDISKAQNELGFLPAYSLEDGLKECIFQYMETEL